MTTPLPHQADSLPTIEKFGGRSLLAMDMGLGKSALSLFWMEKHPEIKRALVICPAFLKDMWQREASHHIHLPAEILSTRKPPKRKGLAFRSRLLIINYDILYWWLDWLAEYDPQLVIIDESQYLMNRKSLRTKSARQLCAGRPHVLALSGTPLLNRHADLWATLNIINPKCYPHFAPFAQRYCNPKRTPWGIDYSRSANSDQLHKELLLTCMVRRRKADVLKDLPPIMHQVIPFGISNRKEYNHALKDFVGWLATQSPALARRAARAEQVVKVGYLKRLAAYGKLAAVFDWLDDYLMETEEKLLVGCIHTKILDELQDHYKDICLRVDGKTPSKHRQELFDAFNGKNKYRFLFGNIDAAGVGWSCRATSKVALVEFPWSPAKVAQFISRCHGYNRGEKGVPVQAYYLTAKETIEERLCDILQKRQEIVSQVLDGGKQADDIDLFDQLVELLKNGG